MKKCPFKQEKTSFYNTDVNDNTEIDYCNAYKIKCVGEKECPIDKMLARFENAVCKLEEYIRVTASPIKMNPIKMKLNLVGKIKVNKKYRIEDEGKPVRNADDWARTKIVYDGAIYPKQHAGHIVKAMKYCPPTGASSTGDVEVECITCGKILDFLISDQFLEEVVI